MNALEALAQECSRHITWLYIQRADARTPLEYDLIQDLIRETRQRRKQIRRELHDQRILNGDTP